jgi:MoaA/NifB/PqqE/SkfB family radical SAM enzyme
MKTRVQKARGDQITIENLLKSPSYFVRGVKYHAAGRLYIPKPVYSSLRVTRRCNARCVMCSDWKRQEDHKELTLAEIGEIYRNPLFSSLKSFGLSGGEPMLREDLAEIAQVVLESCPRIEVMRLVTNGLEPTLVVQRVKELLALCERKRLSKFSVAVSLDGYGATHERIRRSPQAFERVSETLKRLKRLQLEKPFYLCSTCAVQPLNVDNLVQLSAFGQELGLPITFVPIRVSAFYVDDASQRDSLRLTDDQLKKLKILFDHELQPNLTPSNVLFWREYFSMIGGGKRRLPCYLLYYFAEVDSDGTLRTCVQVNSLIYGNVREEPPDKIWYSEKAREIRKRAQKVLCPKCTVCCDMDSSFTEEFFYYASFLLKEKTKKLLRLRR